VSTGHGAQEVFRGGQTQSVVSMREGAVSVIAIGVGLYVYVREYLRFRFGKWENVRSHHRNWPRSS